jgi:DNA-binding transcriptional LysR family regulator
MDHLRALKTFVEIADQGSLTAAADQLDTSLAVVVRTLAALEAHVGVRLFNRTTRRIALTDEGRSYLGHARHILDAVREADTSLIDGSTEPVGPITVTAPVLFGQMHVAPAITRFALRYPRVSVRVLLFDRVVNLIEEGIDLGIRIGQLDDSSVIAQPLGNVRRVVVASPALLAAHGTPTHPNELRDAPCVRFTGAASLAWTFAIAKQSRAIPISGNLEFNHIAPAIDACCAGAGFGLFLSYQVKKPISEGALQIVLAEFEPPPRPIHIIYPHARLLPTRTRLLIEWIKQELGGDWAT